MARYALIDLAGTSVENVFVGDQSFADYLINVQGREVVGPLASSVQVAPGWGFSPPSTFTPPAPSPLTIDANQLAALVSALEIPNGFSDLTTVEFARRFLQSLQDVLDITSWDPRIEYGGAAETPGLEALGRYMRFTDAAPAITIAPESQVPWPPGTLLAGVTAGGPATIVEGVGVTITPPTGRLLATFTAGSTFALQNRGTDVWDITGDLGIVP